MLSPRWRGPYEVIKVPNPFQVQYQDGEKQKITHVRSCKKIRGGVNNGNEQMPAKEGGLKRAESQCQVRRQREMTCHIIDVLDTGSKRTFQNPSHFCKWLGERKEDSDELYIRGVPARGGRGSTEVARFLAKQLRLPSPLHRWKKQVAYLMKQCEHCSGEEGAVCEAQPLESLTEDRRAPTPFEPGTSNGGASIVAKISAISISSLNFFPFYFISNKHSD